MAVIKLFLNRFYFYYARKMKTKRLDERNY